ncbi:hypothetical protein Btru_028125 [Bulinus truncatus]|nr:hypothetical protein Btru_028125 [Bulinus truncatus]
MAEACVSIDAAPDQTIESQHGDPDQKVNSGQNRNPVKSTSLDAKLFNSSQNASESENIYQGSLRLIQTARPVGVNDDSDYLKYLPFFPPHLKEDNNDILIICAHEDMKAADDFKKHLEKDIVLYVEKKPIRPRVKLLENYSLGSSWEYLDLAFEKTLYVFLYVTKDFCECTWTLLQGQACLVEAIRDPEKKWCVIPVHTKSRKNQNYKLPMMLGSLRPINYWVENVDQFYIESVRRLIDSKLSLLTQRDIDLDKKRIEYFRKYKNSLFEKYTEFHKKSPSFSITSQEDSKPSDYLLNTDISQDISSRFQQVNVSDSSSDKPSAQCNEQLFKGSKKFEDQLSSPSENSLSSTLSDGNHTAAFSQNSDSGMSSLPESMTDSITVDGPASINAYGINQSTCSDCGTRSTQSNPSYTFCSSIPQSSPHCMGPDGVLYAQTPFGYRPVFPVHALNANVNQSVVYSVNPYASIPYEPLSQSNQSSLNSSLEPNVSNPQSYQQLHSVSGVSAVYPGFYMPQFLPYASGQANSFPYPYALPTYSAQFIPQGIQTLSNSSDQKQTLPTPSNQKQTSPTLSNQNQTLPKSSDKKASLDTQSPTQMDSSGDAKTASECSSGSVQHIHHHYHNKKEIRIGNATNLVIGDKSKFISTVGSSHATEAFTNLSDTASEDDEVVNDNTVVESPGSHIKDDISRLSQSVPSADCNHDSGQGTVKSRVESTGFPECPEPCSDRQPSEHSESEAYFNIGDLAHRKTV